MENGICMDAVESGRKVEAMGGKTIEKKIWILHLLEEVKKDAIRKAQGKDVTEQVYSAIIQMIKLTKIVRKEGLLAIEWGEWELEPELDNIIVIPMGIDNICDGVDNNTVAEILTTKYWIKNPQGMEAIAYYICIWGLFEMLEDTGLYELEIMFTALLPEECIAEYERRKKERIPEVQKTLLEKEVKLPRRSIIIRNILEEKMEQVTDIAIKTGIRKLGETDNYTSIAFVLRGLNNTYKEKLLSCVSPTRKKIILEDEQYMGPISTLDIEDAFVSLLECIEEAERENSGDKTNANGNDRSGDVRGGKSYSMASQEVASNG